MSQVEGIPKVTFIAGYPAEAARVKELGYEATCATDENGDIMNAIFRIADEGGHVVTLLNDEAAESVITACGFQGVPCSFVFGSEAAHAFSDDGDLEGLLRRKHAEAIEKHTERALAARDKMFKRHGLYETSLLTTEISSGAAANPAIPTGIDNLDTMLGSAGRKGGLPRGGLTTLGALSSMGKTTLCNQIGDNIAASGIPVMFVTCEQSRYELVSMSLSRLVGVEGPDPEHKTWATRSIIQLGIEAWSEQTTAKVTAAAVEYNSKIAPYMYIMECENQPTAKQIRAAAMAIKRIAGVCPVTIVDYLQLIRPEDERRDERLAIGDTVSILRKLARDENTAVLLISALNRKSINQGVTQSAFRESSAIEYSSDLMLGLQPHGLSKAVSGETTETNMSQTATLYIDNYRDEEIKRAEIRILKNRAGRVPSEGVPVEFDPRCSRFMPDTRRWTAPERKTNSNDPHKGATRVRNRKKKGADDES